MGERVAGGRRLMENWSEWWVSIYEGVIMASNHLAPGNTAGGNTLKHPEAGILDFQTLPGAAPPLSGYLLCLWFKSQENQYGWTNGASQPWTRITSTWIYCLCTCNSLLVMSVLSQTCVNDRWRADSPEKSDASPRPGDAGVRRKPNPETKSVKTIQSSLSRTLLKYSLGTRGYLLLPTFTKGKSQKWLKLFKHTAALRTCEFSWFFQW